MTNEAIEYHQDRLNKLENLKKSLLKIHKEVEKLDHYDIYGDIAENFLDHDKVTSVAGRILEEFIYPDIKNAKSILKELRK